MANEGINFYACGGGVSLEPRPTKIVPELGAVELGPLIRSCMASALETMWTTSLAITPITHEAAGEQKLLSQKTYKLYLGILLASFTHLEAKTTYGVEPARGCCPHMVMSVAALLFLVPNEDVAVAA